MPATRAEASSQSTIVRPTPQKMADRAAAEKWVADQAMADCAEN